MQAPNPPMSDVSAFTLSNKLLLLSALSLGAFRRDSTTWITLFVIFSILFNFLIVSCSDYCKSCYKMVDIVSILAEVCTKWLHLCFFKLLYIFPFSLVRKVKCGFELNEIFEFKDGIKQAPRIFKNLIRSHNLISYFMRLKLM